MYPDHDIPLLQISIDATATPEEHHRIGMELRSLRNEGTLLLGSGNIVHNLSRVDWRAGDTGFDWAHEFDGFIKERILHRDHDAIVNYKDLGEIAKLAVPTPDHFNPLLYVLGATDDDDEITVFNEGCSLGSVSMTSYLFG